MADNPRHPLGRTKACNDEEPAPAVVEGYVRLAEHAVWFSPTDDAAGRRFYTLDPASLRRAMTAEGLAEVRFFFDHDGSTLLVRE